MSLQDRQQLLADLAPLNADLMSSVGNEARFNTALTNIASRIARYQALKGFRGAARKRSDNDDEPQR